MVGTVRDATTLTKLGIPSVSVITTQFWEVYQVMAGRTDVDWLPALEVPYPMQGKSDEEMGEIAESILAGLTGLWEGRLDQDLRWEDET